jgi:hypothetical protein
MVCRPLGRYPRPRSILHCGFRPTGYSGPEPPFEHGDGSNGIDLCLLKQIPANGEQG